MDKSDIKDSNFNSWWSQLDFSAFSEAQKVPSYEDFKEESARSNIAEYESRRRRFYATGLIIVFGLASLAGIVGVFSPVFNKNLNPISEGIGTGLVYWSLTIFFGVPMFFLFYSVHPAMIVDDGGKKHVWGRKPSKVLDPVIVAMAENNNFQAEPEGVFPDFYSMYAPIGGSPQKIGPVIYSPAVGGPSVIVFNRSLAWYGNDPVSFLNVIVIDLPRSFHYMAITPNGFYDWEEIPLPVGMEKFFASSAVEAQSDFFYVFTPDILALIKEEFYGMSIHVFRDKLYIVGGGHHDFSSVEGWVRIQGIVQSVGREIVEQVKGFNSENASVSETFVDVQSPVSLNVDGGDKNAGSLAFDLTGGNHADSYSMLESQRSRKWKTSEKIWVILIFTVGMGLCWFLGLLVAPLVIASR